MFTKYLDVDGDSNIFMYELGDDYISVKFYNTERIYTYTYSTAGKINVENMKMLAAKGNGLNSYIKRYCSNLYLK